MYSSLFLKSTLLNDRNTAFINFYTHAAPSSETVTPPVSLYDCLDDGSRIYIESEDKSGLSVDYCFSADFEAKCVDVLDDGTPD